MKRPIIHRYRVSYEIRSLHVIFLPIIIRKPAPRRKGGGGVWGAEREKMHRRFFILS